MLHTHTQWKIDRVTCPITSVCSEATCKLDRPTRQTTKFATNCLLARPLRRVSMHMKSFVRDSGDSAWRPHMIDNTINYCAAANDASYKATNIVARVLDRTLRQHSNLNFTCPVEGWVRFHDVSFEPGSLMEAWMPVAQYRVEFRVFDEKDNTTMFLAKLYTTALK